MFAFKNLFQRPCLLIKAAVLWLCAVSVHAQSTLSPEAVRLLQAPASRVLDQEDISAYLVLKGEPDTAMLSRAGVTLQTRVEDWLTVRMPVASLQAVGHMPFVKYLQPSRTVIPQLDEARAAAGVDAVFSGWDLPQSYTGKGVVIGIVDAGFDYNHINFLTSDHTGCRISRVWEQSTTTGIPPVGYTYGTEFTLPEAIAAAGGDVADNSHGTHVAGIAAGSCTELPWRGVAPEAEIVLVSKGAVTPDNVNLSDAIAYIFHYADSVGKPCVVNLSLGTLMGPHDGTSPFDQLADRLQGPGRLLVGASGNFGHDKVHVGNTFSGDSLPSLRTMVDFLVKPDAGHTGGEVDIWGTPGTPFAVQLQVVNTATGQVAQESEVIEVGQGDGDAVTFQLDTNAKGSIGIVTEINPLNGKPHAQLTFAVSNLRTKYAVALVIQPRGEGRIDAWADDVWLRFTDNGCEDWADGNSVCALGEIGGTGQRILSVGAWTTRSEYVPFGATASETTGEVKDELATFSAYGPTVDGRMKPEVAAPGTYIVSSLSAHDGGLSDMPLAGHVEWNGNSHAFGYMQGTSMAAPFMTGVAALWLQACPELTPEHLKEILSSTAQVDETVETSLTTGWGYGKLDAHAGIIRILEERQGITELGNGGGKVGDTSPLFALRRAGDEVSVRFLRPARDVSLRCMDMQGRTIVQRQWRAVGSGEQHVLPMPCPRKGICLLQVTATEGMQCMKVW